MHFVHKNISTFEDDSGVFNQKTEGFIKLNALRLKIDELLIG